MALGIADEDQRPIPWKGIYWDRICLSAISLSRKSEYSISCTGTFFSMARQAAVAADCPKIIKTGSIPLRNRGRHLSVPVTGRPVDRILGGRHAQKGLGRRRSARRSLRRSPSRRGSPADSEGSARRPHFAALSAHTSVLACRNRRRYPAGENSTCRGHSRDRQREPLMDQTGP